MKLESLEMKSLVEELKTDDKLVEKILDLAGVKLVLLDLANFFNVKASVFKSWCIYSKRSARLLWSNAFSSRADAALFILKQRGFNDYVLEAKSAEATLGIEIVTVDKWTENPLYGCRSLEEILVKMDLLENECQGKLREKCQGKLRES